MLFTNHLIHSSVMFRAKEICHLGGYNKEIVKAQDYELWSRAVAYGNIVGVLIEAMKEQQKQIDELKSRLDGSTK